MSTHDGMEVTNGSDPRPEGPNTHEALCALVLGELEGNERIALERELEASPELRAERARIAATIGLVRAACGGPAALSDGAVARLEGLATAKRRPWYASGTFRMAAGFGLVALSLVLWKEGARRRAPEADVLARADRPAGDVELRRGEAEAKLAMTAERAPAPSAIDLNGFGGSTGDPSSDGETREVEELAGAEAPSEASAPSAAWIPDESLQAMTGFPQGRALDNNWLAGRDAALQGTEGADEVQRRLRQQDRAAAAAPPVDAGERFGVLRAGIDGEQADELAQIGYVAKNESRAVAVDTPVTELGVPKDSLAPFRTNEIEAVDYLSDFDVEPPAAVVEEQLDGTRLYFDEKRKEPDADSDAFFLGRHPHNAPAPTVESARPALGEQIVTPGLSTPAPAAPGPPMRAAGGGGGALGNDPATFGGAGGRGLHGEEYFLDEFATAGEPVNLSGLASTGRSLGAYDDEHDQDGFRGRFEGGQRPLDPETEVRLRIERVLHDCRRHPNEKPAAMYFRFWGDNGFELAQLDPQSTFGVDVDTASYALARRYLRDGYLPEKAQIRTEEFLNYFDADVPAPTESTFAIRTELAPSRFGNGSAGGIRVSSAGDRWMLRVAVRGKDVSREERPPLALTFVVDVSGSMKEGQRLELVKHALRLLVSELDARDSIAIVAFSSEARMVLPMTSAAQRGVIEAALYGLNADGSTNAEAGLLMGYALASANLSNAAQSRVVLLSDGVANVGQTDQDRISAEVRRQRETGIYLNTIGVGMGNVNDVFLEQLANKGDGLCNYMDDELEARRALVENFTGAFTPIARDVKIQVEFDPTQVYRYRLLGYENRAIADQDFRNDAVDAGEIGAGHQVVALYEIELLKPGGEAPLASVRLRWKQPSGAGRDPLEDSATEIEAPVSFQAASAWEGSSAGYKRSVLVAQFAELLRRSTHAHDDSLDELLAEAAALAPRLDDADFTEFVALVEKSRELVLRARPAYEPIAHCVDRLRRNQCLHAEYESLRLDPRHALLEDLERQNLELEARIRDLIREQVQSEMR